MVEYNHLKISLENISLIKLKAVYRGNFHDKIEVLESDIDDEQYLDLIDTENVQKTDLVSRGLTSSLINNYLIPNCGISVLQPAINSFLLRLYNFQDKKQKLKHLESKFNERNCHKLGKFAYLFKKCACIKREIKKLEKLLQELRNQVRRLERFILKCFIVSIEKSWQDLRKEDFAVIEEDAKECTYEQLYSIWKSLNLFKKFHIMFNLLVFSNLRKDNSKSNFGCFGCFGCRNTNKKCNKSIFDEFTKAKEKLQLQIESLEREFGSCISYLISNNMFNVEEELISEHKFTSLVDLIELME
ncbi:uncharacterized protein cubi_00975 [Cryptosporidium ubiquitum]|uniref:Uncharacterized protein n=1 Tax=Cryptosporidium ubiquitum TaxID=857276 RepID=A0A1J4M9D9_9CRYT|nr:uncharacterized protein cubi_00975 [Cryptosporidium ubiquitum]OII70830.1 hypothetical protein cubi_00975 [Cryptosporidium ubiquitum]